MQQISGKIRLHRIALGDQQIGGNQRQVECVSGFYNNTASIHRCRTLSYQI
jgi:hypothetical protein